MKRSQKSLPSKLVVPDGMAVFDGTGQVWYVKGGKRLRCFSKRSAATWHFKPAGVALSQIEHIPDGGVLGFRDGSLLENFANGTIWLISNNKRRLITDPDVFRLFGFEWKDVRLVSKKELEIHDEGEPLDWNSITR